MRDSLGPQRRCLGCRRQASRQHLLRIVYLDGRIVFDQKKILPGRGAWIHPAPACLTQACKGERLTHSLRHRGAEVSELQEEILLWLKQIREGKWVDAHEQPMSSQK